MDTYNIGDGVVFIDPTLGWCLGRVDANDDERGLVITGLLRFEKWENFSAFVSGLNRIYSEHDVPVPITFLKGWENELPQ